MKNMQVFSAAGKSTHLNLLLTRLMPRLQDLKSRLPAADKEIDRAFSVYAQALAFDPTNKALLSEIASNYYNLQKI